MTSCQLTDDVAANCGTLPVPENPADRGGRWIGIRVAVIGAREAPTEPVFFISGGPGVSTIQQFAQAATLFPGLTRRHDVVLIDQRGIGASHSLMLPIPAPGQDIAEYMRRAMSVVDGDPRFYTTTVAMDDLDAVRQALGYRSIDLYGLSYGAVAVQYYLRQHANHVRAAVLDSGSLLNVAVPEVTAQNSQRAMDDLFHRCAADRACAAAYPDPSGELGAVLLRLSQAPVTTNGMTAPSTVVTPELFAAVLNHMQQNATSAADILWLVHRAAADDFVPVAKVAEALRDAPPTQLLAMSWVIQCSEGWARHDPERVRVLAAGSYYGSTMLTWARQLATACPLIPHGVVPAGDELPPRATTPVLFLNGQEDPLAAPAGVADVAQYMPNSLSLIVPGQGHGVGYVSCMPSIVVSFLDSGKTDRSAAERCLARVPTPPIRLP